MTITSICLKFYDLHAWIDWIDQSHHRNHILTCSVYVFCLLLPPNRLKQNGWPGFKGVVQHNVSMESCKRELGLLSEISRGLTLKNHQATKKVFGTIFYQPITTDGYIQKPLFFSVV